MATYSGTYYCDGGFDQSLASLTVFGVNVVEGRGTNLRGDRFPTDANFDALYLPAVFNNHVLARRGCCEAPPNTIRHAKAFYADRFYLFIPCPFWGGSVEFLEFYRELSANPRLIVIESHGETISFNLTTLLRN